MIFDKWSPSAVWYCLSHHCIVFSHLSAFPMKCNESHSCWTGPANSQRRRVGWMSEWDDIIPLCQHVSNPQPSHLLLSVTEEISLFTQITVFFIFTLFRFLYKYLFFPFFSSFLLSPSLLLLPHSWPCATALMWLFLKLCLSHHPVFSSSLTFSRPSFISDVREEKETGSALLIGQGRRHPRLWLYVPGRCVILALYIIPLKSKVCTCEYMFVFLCVSLSQCLSTLAWCSECVPRVQIIIWRWKLMLDLWDNSQTKLY